MSRERVLLVVKKTVIDTYAGARPDPKFKALLAENDPLVGRSRETHAAHAQAVRLVRDHLVSRGLSVTVAHTSSKRLARAHDLVISVGGDGTLLDAAHGVIDKPVLAVNSFPETSVGYFCGATPDTFVERMDAILGGNIEPTALNRISVFIGQRRLHYPALNDILFAHVTPAATSRYLIRVEDLEESHMSSGVWVSTAAGSTGAIHAAGGAQQPIHSRDLQYKVRELFRRPRSDLRLTGGILADGIELVSRLHEGAVFMDGHRVRFRVGYGDVVRVHSHERPLHLFLFDSRKRNRQVRSA